MRLEVVDNSMAWGEVRGRNHKFPDLLECGDDHHYRPFPGMLVTSYEGQLDRMRRRGLDRPGLGIVVAVTPHPEARGSVNWQCTVVWNW